MITLPTSSNFPIESARISPSTSTSICGISPPSSRGVIDIDCKKLREWIVDEKSKLVDEQTYTIKWSSSSVPSKIREFHDELIKRAIQERQKTKDIKSWIKGKVISVLDPNEEGFNAIQVAIFAGCDRDLIELLIRMIPVPNYIGQDILYQDHVEVENLLSQFHRARRDQKRELSLIGADIFKGLKILEDIYPPLRYQINPDELTRLDPSRKTPLHYAYEKMDWDLWTQVLDPCWSPPLVNWKHPNLRCFLFFVLDTMLERLSNFLDPEDEKMMIKIFIQIIEQEPSLLEVKEHFEKPGQQSNGRLSYTNELIWLTFDNLWYVLKDAPFNILDFFKILQEGNDSCSDRVPKQILDYFKVINIKSLKQKRHLNCLLAKDRKTFCYG